MKEFFKKLFAPAQNEELPIKEKLPMKEELKELIISNINSWTDKDIYAISLFTYDYNDNPCKPTVALSYNTEAQVEKQTPKAYNEQEARWNYAFWLQNEFFQYGTKDTAQSVRDWLELNELPFFEDDDKAWDDESNYLKASRITTRFVSELIEIVKEIHESGLLTQKFGKEIPIIIHELEYYHEITRQNIKANGKELLGDFIKFCR